LTAIYSVRYSKKAIAILTASFVLYITFEASIWVYPIPFPWYLHSLVLAEVQLITRNFQVAIDKISYSQFGLSRALSELAAKVWLEQEWNN